MEEMPEDEVVEIEEDQPDVEDTEDGGAVVKFGDDEGKINSAHFDNIIADFDVNDIVEDLLDKISRDKDARKKRDELYEEGLRRTGLGDDAPGGAQFTGANRVVHPMLIEACVDFSARVMKEIFPPNGPVRTKIIGNQTEDKIAKAQRKSSFMNWQLTEQMPEFRSELEQLSTQLPLGGGQYLKLSYSDRQKRPMAEFIPIDDMLIPFAATNFYTAERKTHVQYVTEMEFKKRVASGMYIDLEITSPEMPDYTKSSEANDKIEGRENDSYNEDGLRTIYEVYTEFDCGEGESPYIISIDKSTNKPLALYRNWQEDDEQRKALDWIVEFGFVPWRGAYPIGLTHMIGSLCGAATGALRALLDSAHIQNTPTMLKLKGGPNGQTISVQPTEVVEIEGGLNVDDIRKIAMPLPFNPPSQVLFQLLGQVVATGKGVVQTSFENLASQNPNQPVGTTMALIEQGMIVFSSIHARMHNSISTALKILHRINSSFLSGEDIEAQLGESIDITPEDFDGPMDVVPVSDPNIFSEVQRMVQVQTIMQRADAKPQLYDAKKVEKLFLTQMRITEDVLVGEQLEDMNPVDENVAATMGKRLVVVPSQNHMAHMQIHLQFVMSPVYGQNPAMAMTIVPAMVQHLRDHMLNYYMETSKNAVKSVHGEEQQTQVVMMVQQQANQVLAPIGQVLAQLQQQAQKYQQAVPQDPMLQIAQMKNSADQQRIQAQQAETQAKMQLDQQKMAQTVQLKQAELALQQQKLQEAFHSTKVREQHSDMRKDKELQARIYMNDSDNQTAKELAAAEIMSGEKIAVSTGTGINP